MANNRNPEKPALISAAEVANYVVCPEAWRLKAEKRIAPQFSERAAEGRKIRKAWVEKHDLSAQLKKYAKIAYLLLIALVAVAFLLDQRLQEIDSAKEPVAEPGISASDSLKNGAQ